MLILKFKPHGMKEKGHSIFKYGLIFFLLGLNGLLYAQLTVVQGSAMNMTPQQLVENYLVGSGVTISNATFNGSSAMITSKQVGTFLTAGSATEQLGLESGILMTSGQASIAIGPNSSTGAGTSTNGTGDPDLNIISNSTTFDKAVIEFDFVPQFDTVRFRYVFGSEEFLEFCNSINDAFGFFLSGPGINGSFSNNSINIALMPGSQNLYVTINNICSHPLTRWDNPPGAPNFQYDALTKVFTATGIVQPCSTYHIKLAIADAVDHILDSGVFLEKNSFSSPGVSMNATGAIPALGKQAVEGCNDVTLNFHLSAILSYAYSVNLTIGGTAQNGTDYTQIEPVVVFPAGTDSVDVVIHPLLDLVPEGEESVIITVDQVSCDSVVTGDTVWISDYTPLTMEPNSDTTVCHGSVLDYGAIAAGGLRPYTYLWNVSNQTDSTITYVPPVGVNNLIVRVRDVCIHDKYDTAVITVHPVPVADAGSDITIPNGTSTLLHGNASGGYGNYGYSWTSNPPGFVSSEQNPSTGILSQTTIYHLVVTDVTSGCQSQDAQVMVIVAGGPLSVNPVAEPAAICFGTSSHLYALAGGGSGLYTYSWSSDPPGFTSAESSPEVAPQQTTTYNVTVNDGFNQLFGSTSVEVYPLPMIKLGPPDSTVCVYSSITLDAGNPGSSYEWSNGAKTRKIDLSSSGIGYEVQTYMVTVTNENGCIDSATINVIYTYDACVGINEKVTGEGLVIVPNPNDGNFRLISDFVNGQVQLDIYDIYGQLEMSRKIDNFSKTGTLNSIDVSFIPEGIHIIRLSSDSIELKRKLVIRKTGY
jgi:hypothetical protein